MTCINLHGEIKTFDSVLILKKKTNPQVIYCRNNINFSIIYGGSGLQIFCCNM